MTTREYFKSANPGDFFRKFSPLNQLLALVVLIFFWKYSISVRLCLGAALVLYVICDVLTFSYFYPRNDIMFRTASLTDIELLKKTWSQWNNMNWTRSFILLVGLFFSIVSLHKIYSRNNNNNAVFINTSYKADALTMSQQEQ